MGESSNAGPAGAPLQLTGGCALVFAYTVGYRLVRGLQTVRHSPFN